MENKTTNFDQYRRDVMGKAEEHRQAVLQFTEASTPEEQNTALDKTGVLNSDEQAAARKAFNLYTDKKTGVNLRIKALRKVQNYVYQNAAAIKRVIRVLLNTRENVELRKASLETLLIISFSSPALQSLIGEYKNALRSLVRDRDRRLSAMAIEALSGYQDDFVQQVLSDGLRDHALALVTDAKAIQLLGSQRAGGYNDLIRAELEKSKDPQILIEGIHALSGDPASTETIRRILTDKNAKKNVRLAGLAALNSLDPRSFLETAKSIISDESDYPDVKIASMSAISLQPKYQDLFQDAELTEKVKNLTGHENKALRQESDRYLTNVANYMSSLK